MSKDSQGSNYAQPSLEGHYGEFGGRFVAETLTHALDELTALYELASFAAHGSHEIG